MGRRNVIDWISTGVNSEYKKVLPDLEARIRVVTEGGAPYSLGSGIGSLNNSEYFWDYSTKTLYIKTSDGTSPENKVIQVFTYYQAYGTWGTQAEMENLEIFQKLTAQTDFYIRYVRMTIMKKGNPVFNNMRLDIHPEFNDYPTPKILVSSENTWDNTLNNSDTQSEIWFRFNNYGIKSGDAYCLALKADGTFDKDNHISWIKLDPVYSDGLSNDMAQISKGSGRFVIIGTTP